MHIYTASCNYIIGGDTMTTKELLYVEDALSHEQYFQNKCQDVLNKMQDGELKMCIEQMSQRHKRIFQTFYGLL